LPAVFEQSDEKSIAQSAHSVLFRCSIDDIEKIIVQKNSDMKYSWIDDDALIITLVERHSRVRFPLSESDWEQFRSAHKISTKEVLYCDGKKRK
ncbi:MAG: hypothetical protein NC185_09290, partial [Ruminococcus sp.]|nr:hypothetical protein [Ruminococcus sp.]